MSGNDEQEEHQHYDPRHVFCRKFSPKKSQTWLSQGLEHYVATGDAKKVKGILDWGASPNSSVGKGDDSVLHLAVAKGDGYIVRALVNRGASKDVLNKNGNTPLHLAALVGNVPATFALIKAGANVDVRNEADDESALDLATIGGHLDVVRALTKHGANANTALHHATARNNFKAVKMLLMAKATAINVDALDADGRTPLHVVLGNWGIDAESSKIKLSIVKALARAGANMDARNAVGQTPLYIAAEYNYVDVVSTLVKLGADTNMVDNAGKAPLEVSIHFNACNATAQTLLEAGANANFRTNLGDFSLLDMAARNGHVDLVKTLINHGASVGATDFSGRTAVHHAAADNQAGTVSALLQAGAEIDARDQDGSTPLHRACERISTGAVRCLLVNRATVNLPDGSMQLPLHRAASVSAQDSAAGVVDLLLRAAADETATDQHGLTPAQVTPNHNVSVLNLLENAEPDRAWRRRGFLTMCRALPRKAPVRQEFSTDSSSGQQTNSGVLAGRYCPKSTKKKRRTDSGNVIVESGGGGGGAVGGGVGIERLVTRVTKLQAEDIFRHIVQFL